MRRKCTIKDGNVCSKKSGTPIECPSRQQFMQGDQMPSCRVNCALLSYYRASDDYCEDRDQMNLMYILTCGDERIGCLDIEDLDDRVRSNMNYEPEPETQEVSPPRSTVIEVNTPRPIPMGFVAQERGLGHGEGGGFISTPRPLHVEAQGYDGALEEEDDE